MGVLLLVATKVKPQYSNALGSIPSCFSKSLPIKA